MAYGISTYGISGCSGLGMRSGFGADPLEGTHSQLYNVGGYGRLRGLASRARRGLAGVRQGLPYGSQPVRLGAITPPGYSDYSSGYLVDKGILYSEDEMYASPSMHDEFVPSNNSVYTMGVSTGEPEVYQETPPIEDSEFKDVIEPAVPAKTFGGGALLALAALGYFCFIKK